FSFFHVVGENALIGNSGIHRGCILRLKEMWIGSQFIFADIFLYILDKGHVRVFVILDIPEKLLAVLELCVFCSMYICSCHLYIGSITWQRILIMIIVGYDERLLLICGWIVFEDGIFIFIMIGLRVYDCTRWGQHSKLVIFLHIQFFDISVQPN